ncbi:hypothetical protein [Escherichia coli]|uniref:hypothetical protein n=1 Tax=Escherichia coli TaxID=562 RepID=UPI001BFC696C|nr:hypothetical protein [Escherichia coli]
MDAGKFDAARNSFMVKTLTARQEQAAEGSGLSGTLAVSTRFGSTEGYRKELCASL